ncbi:hypothetical protein ACLUXD_08840 [Loigolactobacillus coryniformis subsp. coryniformis]|jgi:hypothetical protein|uniref:hypothetical protein n=1 Tax=Loigolactobacillus coryniformis TaxID=1610 RepID=UPI00399205DD
MAESDEETAYYTVEELARLIKASRSTVYNRARKYGIKLSGEYTEEQIHTLGRPIKGVSKTPVERIRTQLDSERKAEIGVLEQKHALELESLKREYEAKVSALKASNETIIAALEAKQAKEVADIEREHDRTAKDWEHMRNTLEAQLQGMNEQINGLAAQLPKLIGDAVNHQLKLAEQRERRAREVGTQVKTKVEKPESKM